MLIKLGEWSMHNEGELERDTIFCKCLPLKEQLTSINGFTVFFSSSLFLQIGKGEDDLLHFTERSCIRYPVVPGHEIAGVIHTVGSDVPMTCPLVAGDRVVVYPWVGCGECKVCMKGDSNYCPDWVNSRELGFTLDGGYAEYVKVPHYRYIFKLPEAIPFSTGALLPCSGLTAYAALKKCSTVVQRVQGWEKEVIIAVIGLGGVGQWAVKLIPFCFGRESVKVVGIDISSKKLQAAKEEKLVDEIFQFSSEKATSQQACELFKDLKDKPQVILDFVKLHRNFLTLRWASSKDGRPRGSGPSRRTGRAAAATASAEWISTRGVTWWDQWGRWKSCWNWSARKGSVDWWLRSTG